MNIFKSLMIALAVAPFMMACAGPDRETASVAPLRTMETEVGTVIADADGMTLYTYSKDPKGASDCSGRCARKWPPATATDEPPSGSPLTVIRRPDGTSQYAWRGQPLYRWVKDARPGQTTGHNLGEVWFVARP